MVPEFPTTKRSHIHCGKSLQDATRLPLVGREKVDGGGGHQHRRPVNTIHMDNIQYTKIQ